MAYEQTEKFDGSSPGFGMRVSICGYYSIISDETVNCHFYKRDINGQWAFEANVPMLGATTSFGDSLDIGNEYFVIGDPGYNSSAGRVGVYAISDPSVLIDALSPPPATGDNFGKSVVISDQYILVGSPNSNLNRGKVYLYIKDDGGSWTPYAGNPITPDIRTPEDYFGCSVAISGDNLLVGAYGNNNKTGAIYIFDKNEDTGLWEESQTILASDGVYNDQFGESLAASGEYFVAGARLAESSSGGVNVGAAYIYKHGTSWYEVDKLTGESEGDHFGESVDIDGDYIMVGAPNEGGQGSADIFYKKRSWGHLKEINGSDSVIGDLFGSSVSISGRFALVGDINHSTNGSIYYAENMVSKLRLAQEFSVNREYIPSKASIYLKRVGENNYEYWPISNTSKNVIDSTNFSTIDYGDNIVIFGDSVSGFTGNGYIDPFVL